MRNWEPDVELDTEIAHKIVSAQFPHFAKLKPEYLGRGWDNLCIEYPENTVFRLPTRKEGGELLQNELPILSALAKRLSVRIPEPLHIGKPRNAYPYGFVGYQKLPGQTADHLEWTAPARTVAAKILGEFVKQLHEIDARERPFSKLPIDGSGKSNPLSLLKRIQVRFDQLKPWHDSQLRKALEASMRMAADPVPQVTNKLVHGDLYPRHVLADDRLQITGIIDWGDVRIGHPAVDLSLAFTFFEKPERQIFWDAYGETPAHDIQRLAALRAAMYGFSLLAYGMEECDLPAAQTGDLILERIVNDDEFG